MIDEIMVGPGRIMIENSTIYLLDERLDSQIEDCLHAIFEVIQRVGRRCKGVARQDVVVIYECGAVIEVKTLINEILIRRVDRF